jgi:hypothetical protein
VLLKQVVVLNLPSLRIAVCYLQYLPANYVLAILLLLKVVLGVGAASKSGDRRVSLLSQYPSLVQPNYLPVLGNTCRGYIQAIEPCFSMTLSQSTAITHCLMSPNFSSRKMGD